MSAENTLRLKRLLLEGFGRGDMSVIDEAVAEDFVEHQQGLPQGREGPKNVIRDLRQAFPALSYAVVQIVEDGDKAWGHFRARGTNEGPFMGRDPSGKVMEIDVIDISRFEDGKMMEHWGVPDRHGTSSNWVSSHDPAELSPLGHPQLVAALPHCPSQVGSSTILPRYYLDTSDCESVVLEWATFN